ncbi:ATP-binding protein [Actinokineospora iranica]|uniref:DNA replication protein DnaC n=1 Tax=Actinokineospora iranica TaxID=1271860 RepID=A0A1G6VTC3_9PSEU|nr:ATP-binding protein [Actinokineospora iranica]SDD56799.1 DNA replication protein DnaC [Actinokineospora iranica]
MSEQPMTYDLPVVRVEDLPMPGPGDFAAAGVPKQHLEFAAEDYVRRTAARARENRAAAAEACRSIPHRYRRALPEHPEVRRWVVDVVGASFAPHAGRGGDLEYHRWVGPSLLIGGRVGVGKTHLAYGAVRALAASGLRMPDFAALSAPDLHAAVRPRPGVDTEGEFRRYAQARVLLLDDLGVRKTGTDWTEEIDYRLVNARYDGYLPSVFTTNLTLAQLKDTMSDRVVSRLVEMCRVVIVDGEDRRWAGLGGRS